MPTSATHITVVRRIAASGQPYAALLGNPDPALPVTDPEAIKMRFASLGACGPDFLYALMDYGPDLQDLENILVKTAATFDGLGDLMGAVQERVDGVVGTITFGVSDSLKETSDTLTALMHEGVFALLAGGGVNPFAAFEARRQQDMPRDEWFWADVLHYWRSGRFVRSLMDRAQASGNPNLVAYALGYATHYVTDVVGHPFVNQVVGAPWRLYWQRHHLVENFMDAYVWDRWHAPVPAAGRAEPPLDRLTTAPNAIGTGAPLGYARLHDHVNIGTALPRDPVDQIVDDVAADLKTMLADLGLAVNTEPRPPTDADAVAWSEMFVAAMHQTYDGAGTPLNLAKPFMVGGRRVTRPDGFPLPTDVAAAYGAFRLILRVTTEETVSDPKPPNILSDISAAVAKIGADVAADLAAIPPPPSIPAGGAFSPAAILDALEQAAEWAAKVAAATIKAAFDFIAGTLTVGATIIGDTIKYALWLVSKALFALYRCFRDVLTLRAYANPFSDQLTGSFGALDAATLWQSPGNPPAGTMAFPREEVVEQRKLIDSRYLPFDVPATPAEMPALDFVAPYAPTTVPGPQGPMTLPALPDAFIDGPLGPDDLFAPSGPQAALLDASGTPVGFRADPKDFGGAIANSMRAIDLLTTGPASAFPDYNLDGDRTYAWPCWDTSPPPTRSAGGVLSAPSPLDPASNPPSMVATVTAVAMP